MKKIFTVSCMLFACGALSAQIKMNQYLVGGNAGFSTSTNNGRTSTNVQLNPAVGRFLADKFAMGMEFSLSSSSETGNPSTTTYIIAPFARYYFLPVENKTNVFLHASYGFGSSTTSSSQYYSSYSSSANAFGFMFGPAIFLNEHVALEITVAYTSAGGDGYLKRISAFGVNVGFQIHLGSPVKESPRRK